MDEQHDKKVRDLKLKVVMTEKELAASQHNAKLGAWLKAGHAGQISKNAARDRERLEARLEDLRAKLAALTVEPPPPVVEPEKKTAAEKPVAAMKPRKKAAK
jgi:hypothetical protein